MHPQPTTGGPALSSAALRLLSIVCENPGLQGPSGWAAAHSWDPRETQDAYRELLRAGMVLPLDGVRWRLGPLAGEHRAWAWRDVPAHDQAQRLVAMAWGEGWTSIEDVCAATGLPRSTCYAAIGRAVQAGRCWPPGTCVPR